ncbi:MAG: 4-(cytidine 5'-diphospho)-2-C-methyl-D-erythritol kinase [Hyphomicrobium sp.]
MTVITEFAPAKINLTLEVLGRRADGYHELKSLVAFADVGDTITLDTSLPRGVSMSGPFASSIAGANLVETTLQRIAVAYPHLTLGAIHLEKNLPVAAGIGGGSADAAAVLRAVRRANAEFSDKIDWYALALSLGADVPVCFHARLSWMTGLGEHVEPVYAEHSKPFAGFAAVIVNPLVPVPVDKTAQVFRALGAPPLEAGFTPASPPTGANDRVHLMTVVSAGSNALEAAAVRVVPAVATVLDALRTLTVCRLARMSGGGPTSFALYETLDAAEAAREVVATRHPAWWVIAVRLM